MALKSNADEDLDDDFSLKGNADEAVRDAFFGKYGNEALSAKKMCSDKAMKSQLKIKVMKCLTFSKNCIGETCFFYMTSVI